MADTRRTVDELRALLADNTTGDITPQRIRDMLVSVASPLLQLYEPGWKDVVFPLITSGVPSNNAPNMAAFGPSGLRRELAFAVGNYSFVGPLHLNHDIKPGGQMLVHIHWAASGTDTNPVRWQFEIIQARGHGQEAFGTPIVIEVQQAPTGTPWQHMVTEIDVGDALTMNEPDELVLVTVRRITNGATNNANSIFGLCVDLHYQADRQATVNRAPDFYI
jgi:hypothetical protein